MASHLTFTTTTAAGVTATKGLSAQAAAPADGGAETGIMGVFAALLGAANQTATTTASAEASVDLSLGNLVNLSFGAGFGSEDSEETEDPEAVAVAIDATLPFQAPIETKPTLTNLVDSLTKLKQSLEAGDAIDPELLKRIDATLDDLAAHFDIDISAPPTLDDLKTLIAAILPGDVGIEQQLTAGLAPLAETLLSGSTSPKISADVELSGLIKTIGEKLGALLKSLNGNDIAPEQLAALGLTVDADAAADTDLEAAIAKLLDPAVKVEAKAEALPLAAPQLKLTETVLTGKASVEAAATTTDTAAVATDTPEAVLQVAASTDNDSQGTDARTGDEGKPNDAKVATAAVAGAVTAEAALPDPQASAQPTQVASRIDAAAARPVIQAGYQTSQQQLNLPQIAFELVRQVNDGNTRFQMRLDPPELGKIDVKLDIDATGQVNARLTVERAETLDLMQRDQRGLERALQQAGLDSAKTNLEFSLKQSPFSGGNQQGQDGSGRPPQFGGDATAEADDAPPPMVNLYRGSLTASGVNIIA